MKIGAWFPPQDTKEATPGPYDTRVTEQYLFNTMAPPPHVYKPRSTSQIIEERTGQRLREMNYLLLQRKKVVSMDAKKQLEYNKNRERKEPYRSFVLSEKQQIHFSMYGTEIYDGLIHGIIYLMPQAPHKISQIQILNKSFIHKITLP